MTDEQQIRTLIERWADAVRRRDLDTITARHAADMVMFDVPGPLRLDGINAYRESWARFYAWAHDPVVFAIDQLHVKVGGAVAFAVATMRCAGGETAGDAALLRFRLTVGLERIGADWCITHEHHSIPAE